MYYTFTYVGVYSIEAKNLFWVFMLYAPYRLPVRLSDVWCAECRGCCTALKAGDCEIDLDQSSRLAGLEHPQRGRYYLND